MATHSDTGGTPTATILRFPRRRGRPRNERPKRDTGTPELIMKRLKGETSEALDLCLERGIITHEQHWSGIHLRWLYTLRYGAPGIRAIDPSHLGGIEHKPDDPEWRTAREQEYNAVIRKLSQSGCLSLLAALCIYNERPAFLKSGALTKARAQKMTEMITRVRTGLDILAEEWRRG